MLIYPIDGFVGEDAGYISAIYSAGAVLVNECGIVVIALSRQDFPMVETRGCGDEVPFAYNGRLVTSGLQELGHGLLGAVEDAMLVVGEAIDEQNSEGDIETVEGQ